MRLAPVLRLAALVLTLASAVLAQESSEPALEGGRGRELTLPPPAGDELVGKPILRLDVIVEGERFNQAVTLKQVVVGQAFSAELARRALHELTDSGRFADVRVEVEAAGGGVILRLHVVPRRVVAR